MVPISSPKKKNLPPQRCQVWRAIELPGARSVQVVKHLCSELLVGSTMAWQKGKCYKLKKKKHLSTKRISCFNFIWKKLHFFWPGRLHIGKIEGILPQSMWHNLEKATAVPPCHSILQHCKLLSKYHKVAPFLASTTYPRKCLQKIFHLDSFHENLFRTFGVQPHPPLLGPWVFPSASRSIIFMSNSVAAIRNPRTKSCAPFPGVESQQMMTNSADTRRGVKKNKRHG